MVLFIMRLKVTLRIDLPTPGCCRQLFIIWINIGVCCQKHSKNLNVTLKKPLIPEVTKDFGRPRSGGTETYCSKKAKALNYRAKMNYHPCQPVPEGRVRLRHQKKCNQHRLCYKLQTHKLPVFLHSFKKTVPSATLAFVWPPGQSLRLS